LKGWGVIVKSYSISLKTKGNADIIDQSLTLGTWQQIVFIDFDIHPSQRQVILQIIGE
jgi:thiamine phosphate synthase YjbQ (UPF0047 family)